MIVHLAGKASDMDGLMAVAREHNLFVIEDCAQSWGATYRGQPVGLFGDLACYSFNEFKHVSCGDGGIVGTNDPRFGPTLRKWGDKHYDRVTNNRNPEALSPNYRMSEPQAAVAAAQLVKLPAIIGTHVRFGTRLLGLCAISPCPASCCRRLTRATPIAFGFVCCVSRLRVFAGRATSSSPP